jgi:hypothetical protein
VAYSQGTDRRFTLTLGGADILISARQGSARGGKPPLATLLEVGQLDIGCVLRSRLYFQRFCASVLSPAMWLHL